MSRALGSGARILVTGGAGFIGQNFVHHLVKHAPGTHIVVLDALTYAANPASLKPLQDAGQIIFERGDITDIDHMARLFQTHGFDTVAHLAAESHVDRSISGPDAFIQTNIIGTYNLLKTALADWKGRDMMREARFLHVSTDEVFGDLEPDDAPFHEETPYRPSSPYSASKASSDHLARAFLRTYGLPVLVTNCSNNYGPYQHPEKLIPLMILNALQGQALPIYGDGLNVRDWLHVSDHCHALTLVLEGGQVGRTYNVGGGAERTNREVVAGICAAIDAAFAADPGLAVRYPECPAARGRSVAELVRHVGDRPGHDRRYAIDPTRLAHELGYQPGQTFEDGLKLTVAWYLANEAWCHQALSGGFRDWIERNYVQRNG
jgi:dTDP-glucose 4,6-dehydratase